MVGYEDNSGQTATAHIRVHPCRSENLYAPNGANLRRNTLCALACYHGEMCDKVGSMNDDEVCE